MVILNPGLFSTHQTKCKLRLFLTHHSKYISRCPLFTKPNIRAMFISLKPNINQGCPQLNKPNMRAMLNLPKPNVNEIVLNP